MITFLMHCKFIRLRGKLFSIVAEINSIAILLLLFNGCMPARQPAALRNVEGYKKTTLSEISFFGEVRMDSISTKKKPINIFYDASGKLAMVQPGSKNAVFYFSEKEGVFTLNKKSMSVRYLDVDTLLFYKERCYHKRVYYSKSSDYVPVRWVGMTYIAVYEYKNDSLSVSHNNYHSNDSLDKHESLVNFVNLNEAGKQIQLEPYHALETDIDIEVSKLSFFRKYFMW